MRGAVSFSEWKEMTPWEKNLIREYLSSRMEIELKKPNPVY